MPAGLRATRFLPGCPHAGFLTLDTLKVPAFKARKLLAKLEFYFRSDCQSVGGPWERARCSPFIHHEGVRANGVLLPAPPDDPLPDEFFAERAKSVQAVYDTIVTLEKEVDSLRALTHGGSSTAYRCDESRSLEVDKLPLAKARRLSELEAQLDRALGDAKAIDEAYSQVHGRQDIPWMFPE